MFLLHHFQFSIMTNRFFAASWSRVQLSHKPSWSVKETRTLLSYITSVTMSLVSMYTESGFRLKRLPKAVISFATFSARCWGVCLLLAWHKNKTAYPHLPQPEHPVFHDARSQYAVSDWPVSPNRQYMQPTSSAQSPSGDWLHSTGQPPVPFHSRQVNRI